MELVDTLVCELSHRRNLLLYRTSMFLPVYTGCQETMTARVWFICLRGGETTGGGTAFIASAGPLRWRTR